MWSAFNYGPLEDFSYGQLEIINSTTLKWKYFFTNQTLIDKLTFQKYHTLSFENELNTRKHIVDLNETSKPIVSSSTAKTKQGKIIILVVMALMSLLVIMFVFYYARSRIRANKKKFFANYSNLVENEFDN